MGDDATSDFAPRVAYRGVRFRFHCRGHRIGSTVCRADSHADPSDATRIWTPTFSFEPMPTQCAPCLLSFVTRSHVAASSAPEELLALRIATRPWPRS